MLLRVTFPCFGKIQKNDVGPIVLDGDISITQTTGSGRCIFKLRKADYMLEETHFVVGSASNDEERMFVGYFQVIQSSTYSVYRGKQAIKS